MEKQRENGKSDRIRKKLMQGVLGCLFAMGIMLLMPGTGMKAQATPYIAPLINGIFYYLNSDNTYAVNGYVDTVVGTEVHIPAEIEYGDGNRYRVTGIRTWAFEDEPLEKITLEEGIEYIASAAFKNTKITEIELPASVKQMDVIVFSGCPLTKITFRGMTPPQMRSTTLDEISGNVTIEIPQGAGCADLEVWKAALQGAGLEMSKITIETYTLPSSGSSSPSPAKQGGGEASLEAEEEPVNRIPEHVCQYEWETVREAGAGQDGLEQYLCKLCGSVQSTLTIPASQYQVQELYTKVTAAAEGETVTYDMGQIHTVCDKLFTKLQERSDVTLILTYRYKGQDYQTTFPAGADYTELLADKEQFYGMLGLKGRCGIVTE